MSNLFVNSNDEAFKKRCATLVTDLVAEEIAREPADLGHSVLDQISHNWWCSHFAELLMSEDFDTVEKSLRGNPFFGDLIKLNEALILTTITHTDDSCGSDHLRLHQRLQGHRGARKSPHELGRQD